MKKLLTYFGFAFLVIFSSSHQSAPGDLDVFGKNILNTFKNNNFQSYEKLMLQPTDIQILAAKDGLSLMPLKYFKNDNLVTNAKVTFEKTYNDGSLAGINWKNTTFIKTDYTTNQISEKAYADTSIKTGGIVIWLDFAGKQYKIRIINCFKIKNAWKSGEKIEFIYEK